MPNTDPTDFGKIDAQKVEQTIQPIDDVLKDKPVSKQVKQKLNYAKENWPKNLKKIVEQEKILKGRNSYSKRNTDAIFMLIKEYHMLNGQLKLGYYLQIATNNQYIVNYSLHSTTTYTTTYRSIPKVTNSNISFCHKRSQPMQVKDQKKVINICVKTISKII